MTGHGHSSALADLCTLPSSVVNGSRNFLPSPLCTSGLHVPDALRSSHSLHRMRRMLQAVQLEHDIGTQVRHLLRHLGACDAELRPDIRPHVREPHRRADLVLRHGSRSSVSAPAPSGRPRSNCLRPRHSLTQQQHRNTCNDHRSTDLHHVRSTLKAPTHTTLHKTSQMHRKT
ncbi:hypothetical protein KC19_12G084100 [Ceratodon purpureus]|uniref:Uncharacterized protein n=1 Tax=Ceratodon purpureus TaxID=3225 RepID=A0A8T0G601_CERPU|nr:hypothetical protein KC19_12G084100 [Ceratodon purpureus]